MVALGSGGGVGFLTWLMSCFWLEDFIVFQDLFSLRTWC